MCVRTLGLAYEKRMIKKNFHVVFRALILITEFLMGSNYFGRVGVLTAIPKFGFGLLLPIGISIA